MFFIFQTKTKKVCKALILQGIQAFALEKKITLIFAEINL